MPAGTRRAQLESDAQLARDSLVLDANPGPLVRVGRKRVGRGLAFAGLCVALLSVLSALVATRHLVPAWDRDFLHLLRPHDEWKRPQRVADYFVEGMRPSHTAVAAAVAGLTLTAVRRSWRPIGFVLVCMATASLAAYALKSLVARPDPHLLVGGHGGSFPSGHTTEVLVCAGALALLQTSPVRRAVGWLLTLLATGTIASTLLLQGAHWLTDVIGAVLLAGAILAVASTLDLRRPLTAVRGNGEPARAAGTARIWLGTRRSFGASGTRVRRCRNHPAEHRPSGEAQHDGNARH